MVNVMKYLEKKNKEVKISPNFYMDDEVPVQGGLALTPAQAMEMVRNGVPISNQNLQLMEIYETKDNDFSVPSEFQRNADMADMYQQRQDILKKVKKGQDDYLVNLSNQSKD